MPLLLEPPPGRACSRFPRSISPHLKTESTTLQPTGRNSDGGADVPNQLDRRSPYPAAAAMDQDPLSPLHCRQQAQIEPGGCVHLWESRSLDLVAQVGLIFVGALGIAALLPKGKGDEE